MLEMQLHDGAAFRPEEVAISITLPDGRVVGWADVALVRMIEPEYAIKDGTFGGPDGMPIRQIGFRDSSDLRVEVPLPLEYAREIGVELASKKIQIATTIPSSLIAARVKGT